MRSFLLKITSLFVFLTAAVFFLGLIPNISKPANAASCSISSASVAAGGPKTVTYSGFAQGEGFVLSPVNGSPPVPTNVLTAVSPTDVTIPSGTPSNSYNMVIVTRFPITYTICTGGPFTVTAGTAGTLSCSYTPSTVAPTGTINVTHKGFAVDENILLFGVGMTKVPRLAGTAEDSQTASKTQPVNIPVQIQNGTYNILISTRFPIIVTVCTGGPLVVSDTTTSTATCKSLTDCSNGVGTGVTGFSEKSLIGDFMTKILPIILGIVGMLTIIMIVISGFQFATSSGNPESAAAARGRLTFALVGFAIVALAFALTQIIDVVFLNHSGIF